MVELGDLVKDIVSGFKGITVVKCSYLQGCDRFGVQAKCGRGNAKQDWIYFDDVQLKVIKKGVIKRIKKESDSTEVGGFQPDNAERP